MYFIQNAMGVMGIPDAYQDNIMTIVGAILHIGNIDFIEEGNYAKVKDDECKFI